MADRKMLEAVMRARLAEAGRCPTADGRRALLREAAAVRRVAVHRSWTLDPGGPLPWGPARGWLRRETLREFAPGARGERVVAREVVRLRGASVLLRLDEELRLVAERYAALAEAVEGAPASRVYEGGGTGGGISDGGAVARCRLAERLRRAEAAIGDDPVLTPRRGSAEMDRGRRTLTVREVVDGVCLGGLSIDTLLARHGWSRRQRHRRAVRAALEAALRRLLAIL